MKIGKTREELVESIMIDAESILTNNAGIDRILEHLEKKHGIPKKIILNLINKTSDLQLIDLLELGLIGEQIALETGADSTWLNQFFNPSEIERMRIYRRAEDYENIVFSFRPAIRVSHSVYYISVPKTDIAKMFDRGVFPWSEKVQREGERKIYNGREIMIPKMNHDNVNEIAQQVNEGILMENELAYNLVLGSSPSGQELHYDDETFTLTFSEEFAGQIIDGFHRTTGIHKAWLDNPNITGNMPVRISNYDTKEAMRYPFEQSKAIPIDRARLAEMNQGRKTNRIVDTLKVSGELKGKISNNRNLNKEFGELVSYDVLSDAFYFFLDKGEDSKILVKAMRDFQEYLLYLFAYFEEKYLNNKEYTLFDNYNFYWHVMIFKYMMDNEIPYNELDKVIDVNYFNTSAIKEKYDKKVGNFNYINAPRKGKKHIEDMIFSYEKRKDE